MQTNGRTCFITGANGYVGNQIAGHFEQAGWNLIELGRHPSGADRRTFIPWSLTSPLENEVCKSADVLIHCAWDFSPLTLHASEAINYEGAVRLFEKAQSEGVKKIIFISTTSAFPEAKSLYGITKLKVEKWVLSHGGIVVRPGLVWGNTVGAMMGALAKAASKLPIVPLPGTGNQKFYPCFVDDLAACVEQIASSALATSSTELSPLGPITAASLNPVTLKEILVHYAKKAGKNPLFIPVPWQPLYFLIQLLERIGLKLRFRSDSLLSLMNLDMQPDFKTTRQLSTKLSFKFRDFA